MDEGPSHAELQAELEPDQQRWECLELLGPNDLLAEVGKELGEGNIAVARFLDIHGPDPLKLLELFRSFLLAVTENTPMDGAFDVSHPSTDTSGNVATMRYVTPGYQVQIVSLG